jgi:ribosomal protein S18 acetylase RimI-like enzyme
VRSENGLRLATAADSEPVAELAARSFVYSRFHNDPKLSPEIARRVHYEWARNSVLGQAADAVWVSEARGQIVGFITARLMGEVGSIVLIAVDPAFAGQGHGKKLVAQAQNWFAEKGVKRVEVQTQTANLPALALYFHTGFRLRSASFTLRWSI